jgi:hypothetical protein
MNKIQRKELDYITLSNQLVGLTTCLKINPSKWPSQLRVNDSIYTINNSNESRAVYKCGKEPTLMIHSDDGLNIVRKYSCRK